MNTKIDLSNFKMCYCYHSDCPARTEKEPWPYGQGKYGKGRTPKCPHCKRAMTVTCSIHREDY